MFKGLSHSRPAIRFFCPKKLNSLIFMIFKKTTRHYPARQGGAKLGSVCHPRMSKYVVCYVPARQFENHWISTDFMLGYGRLSKCCVFETFCKKVPPKWLQNGTPNVPTLSLNLTFWDVFSGTFKIMISNCQWVPACVVGSYTLHKNQLLSGLTNERTNGRKHQFDSTLQRKKRFAQ